MSALSAPSRREWPNHGSARVPNWVYTDPQIFARELDRIFSASDWLYLCLEAEIPNPGDFRTTYVGDTPVIVNRGANGTIHALVNRCAHRGAMVRREMSGNASEHTCIYHQWCYGLDGRLNSIPFRRGIRGKGGLDPSFDMYGGARPAQAAGRLGQRRAVRHARG